MITQTLKLNLIPGQVLPRVNVSQYDAGTRTLQMLLYNGDQVFNIASGMSAFVQGTKPDRTGFQYSATSTEGSNVVTLVITQQMTAVSGEVTCELVIASGNDRIATINFILYVEPAALADDTVISETELPLIEEAAELAQRIDGIAADVEADADRAEAAADNAETWVSNYPRIGQNGNWFVFDTTTETFVDTGVSATGPQGPQGDDGPTGPQGPTGPTGNGIVSITKTGTSGLVDTYTILFTDGTTTTFTVTNGQDGQGSGDMTKAVYDSTNAVADAGGIVAYVASQAGAGSLSGLSDVSLSTLANGESLVYNSTSQKWENGSVSYSSLSGKPALGTASAKDSTNAVTSGSTDLVESGAVYSEIQSLDNSKAAKTQITNPNLLDNPWFTVNQRGQSSYTSAGYTVDRWKNNASTGTTTVNSDGSLTIAIDSTRHFLQLLDKDICRSLLGKTITISVNCVDVTGVLTVRVRYTKNNAYYGHIMLGSIHTDGIHSISGIIPSDADPSGMSFEIYGNDTSSVSFTIKAVKLELGSVSTLAMDTAPNYATELLKCQRYFYRPIDGHTTALFQGINFNTTQARFGISLPTPMRTTPTITHNLGTRGQLIVGGTNITVSDTVTVTINSTTPNMIVVAVDGFTGLTADTPIIMKTNSAYIDLSADL